MRLKSFYAKTMTEAMHMVRDTLGDDAIIVATREENGGKAVRVTAAIDPNDYDESREFSDGGRHKQQKQQDSGAFSVTDRDMVDEGAGPPEDWLQYDDEEDEEFAAGEEITDAMLHHNVPEDVMDHVLSCANVIGLEDAPHALTAAIEHLFHFIPLPKRSSKKPILLIGPPGAGKTLAAAKLATRAAMSGVNIGVISSDTLRAGGVAQLKAFTDLLNVDLLTASSATDLQHAVKKFAGFDQVIIDTPGINPFDPDDIRLLAGLIKAQDALVTVVLPAGLDSTESGEMARAFAAMGATHLLPTRIDMARRVGGLLAAAHYGGLRFTDGSNSSKVSGGIFSLNPQVLAKIIMPHAFKTDENERPLRRTAGDL